MTHLNALFEFFGPQAPIEQRMRCSLLHELAAPNHRLQVWELGLGEPEWASWLLYQASPMAIEPGALLLSPDGCWPHVIHEAAIRTVVDHGQSLVWFDRLVLAWDPPSKAQAGLLQRRWPTQKWSAVAAWAWGIRQCVSALAMNHPQTPIGVIGHSRGGKAALVAAALDDRIAAVISHNSGAGGVASLQHLSPGSERLEDLALAFPHWLGDAVQDPAVRQRLIQSDAPKFWLASIAPRGLCVLQAKDDAWANPLGTLKMVEQLTPKWLDAPHALQHHERLGGHAMTPLDWERAARFIAHMRGGHAQTPAPTMA